MSQCCGTGPVFPHIGAGLRDVMKVTNPWSNCTVQVPTNFRQNTGDAKSGKPITGSNISTSFPRGNAKEFPLNAHDGRRAGYFRESIAYIREMKDRKGARPR